MIHIVPASYQHAEIASEILLPKSVEALDKMGFSPLQAIVDSLDTDFESYTAFYQDKLCCMFGIGSFEALQRNMYVWTLPTQHMLPHMILYIKLVKQITDAWLSKYVSLFGIIDTDYKQAIRTYELAGFRKGHTIPYNGHSFTYMRKD